MESLSSFEMDAEVDILFSEPSENNCDYQKGLITVENELPSLLLQGLISCMAPASEDALSVWSPSSSHTDDHGSQPAHVLSNLSTTPETGLDRVFFFLVV